ncbi:hypothetical protein D7X25_22125, partial [bacterium 1XD42-8]
MDNMRSHRVKAVREILTEKGMKGLYLPPYSPDLNPSSLPLLIVSIFEDCYNL